MPLWTPARISTALWLDASDSSTLYDATSGGSLVAADGAVARWQDKSGNSRHVTQATLANRPQRKTSIQNSLDIARFDGNDLLETTFASFGTSYAVVLAAMATNATSANGGLFACRSKTTVNPINPQVSYNLGVSQFAVRDDAGNINSNNISGLVNNTWYLFGGERSGNNVTTYRNGVPGTTGTNLIGTTTTTVTSVGALYTGTANPLTFLTGDIGEIIVCSVGDRVIAEGYAAHKWGLQSSLSNDHPYKNAAPSYGGSSPINGQSLIRPAGSAQQQLLIQGATS
jgi:hypothetical protein